MSKNIRRFNQLLSAPGILFKRGGHTKQTGLGTRYLATASYDVSGGDSGAVGAHGLGVYIPDNAIITKTWFDVVTTFTDGADDSATIALGLETQAAAGILAATAVSAAGNILDAGVHAGLIGFPALGADAAHDTQPEVAALFAATFVKTTAERQLVATVADDALTAGKLNLFVEYVLSD